MKRLSAHRAAAHALTFLAQDPEALHTFLSASGLTADELRDRFEDSLILEHALRFIAEDETRARDFCAANGLRAGDLITLIAQLDPEAASGW